MLGDINDVPIINCIERRDCTMELWFTEKQTKHFGITARINRTLHTEQTEFQKLDMVETEEFGNMLILDGMVMTTEKMSSCTMKW